MDEERTWLDLLDWTFLNVIEKAKTELCSCSCFLLEAFPISWDSCVKCNTI